MNLLRNLVYLKILTRQFGIETRASPILLILGGVMMSLMELIGVSALFPMIILIMNPDIIHTNKILSIIYNGLHLESPRELVVVMGALIAGIFIFKGFFNIAYWRYEFMILAQWRLAMTQKFYNSYINTSYSFFSRKNSSEIINNIGNSIPDIVNNYLHQIINLTNYSLTAFLLIGYIVYLNWIVALIVMFVGGGLLLAHSRLQKRATLRLGEQTILLKKEQYALLQQSFAGFKETRLHSKEDYFSKKFRNVAASLAKAEQTFLFYRVLPGVTVELVVMISVIVVFCVLVNLDTDLNIIVAQLGVMAMTSFRLIPLINRSITALIMIHSGQFAIDRIKEEYNQLNKEKTENIYGESDIIPDISFDESLSLKYVSYAYPDSSTSVLSNINFNIKPGQFVGITGPSGGGKSTLVHILLGFITEFSGTYYVDSAQVDKNNIRGLRKIIGFVDQQIFVMDSTIAENIAFGIDPQDIDRHKVEDSLRKAQLWDFVNTLEKGIDAPVGELGKWLSGGQRQRLGIARALYRDLKILILDEASAALDVETENQLFTFLETLKGEIAVIMIAHRLSTLKNCDRVDFIDSGQIAESGTFSELYRKNKKFKNYIDYSQIKIEPQHD